MVGMTELTPCLVIGTGLDNNLVYGLNMKMSLPGSYVIPTTLVDLDMNSVKPGLDGISFSTVAARFPAVMDANTSVLLPANFLAFISIFLNLLEIVDDILMASSILSTAPIISSTDARRSFAARKILSS